MIIAKTRLFTKLSLIMAFCTVLNVNCSEYSYFDSFKSALASLIAKINSYVPFKADSIPTALEEKAYFNQQYDKFLNGELNIDYCNKRGQTLLMQAIKLKKFIIAHHLIEKNANLRLTDKFGVTVLNHAVLSGNLYIVDLILQRYLDNINIGDFGGFTPLMNAIIFCKNQEGLEIIKRLLNEKAIRIDLAANDTRTAFDLAEESGRPEILELLLEHESQ